MGTWGPGLYQDDVAEDVKDYYKDQLHRGKTGEELTQELIEEYRENLFDIDDAPVFWFALADTQWNLGRLESLVKEKALYYLDEGSNLERWKNENSKLFEKRKAVLEKLKEKLLSEQPEKKKISQYRLYHCKWEIGDVFAYQLKSEYSKEKNLYNKYLFFTKIDEDVWHPGHIIPTVYFYWVISDRILTLEELNKIPYIPQFFVPKVYKNRPNRKILYRLNFLSTSERLIPKSQLTFLGNIADKIDYINNEDTNSYNISWKKFENYIINNFNNWNE